MLGANLHPLAGLVLLTLFWGLLSGFVAKDLPSPLATFKVFWDLVSHPFYDNGPNDKGIGIQLIGSLGHVFVGFALGSLLAIPLGVLMGAEPAFKRMFYWSMDNQTETVVIVTHDIEEAILLSDKIVVMTNGPEATIGEVIEVPIPRPRRKRELVHHPAYAEIHDRLLYLLVDAFAVQKRAA